MGDFNNMGVSRQNPRVSDFVIGNTSFSGDKAAADYAREAYQETVTATSLINQESAKISANNPGNAQLLEANRTMTESLLKAQEAKKQIALTALQNHYGQQKVVLDTVYKASEQAFSGFSGSRS